MGVDRAYFATGDTVYDYDLTDDCATGSSWQFATAWQGLPPEFAAGADAAVDLGEEVLYVFRGREFVRIPFATQAVDAGYPRPVQGDPQWGALSFATIDAAMNWGDGKVYFFSGPDYVRYDIASRQQDPGYPAPIGGGNWKGVDAGWVGDGIDAAINPGNGRAYLFKGAEYVAIDWQAKALLDGYPLAVEGQWPGLAGPFDAAWTNAAGRPQGAPAASGGSGGAADFAARYRPYAEASQQETAVPALVTLGQAALESGWGQHAPGNNFFGIKAKATDSEDTRQLLRTTEVLSRPDAVFPEVLSVTPRADGKYTYVVRDWFRVYPTPAEGFTAHGRFLRDNSRYAAAFDHLDDPYAFARAVADAGYATAPDYYDSLAARMRQIEAAS
jgi:hypothetical protein